MTAPDRRQFAPQVRCPICLTRLGRRPPRAVRLDGNGVETPFVPTDPSDPMRTRSEELAAYRICDGGETPHYLPLRYGEYGTPIVIGVIGAATSGKTTLLAAMIGSLMEAVGHSRLPIQVDALDLRMHARFMSTYVNPLLVHRTRLSATRMRSVELTDALRVHTGVGGPRAVVFFDVAGEQLENADRENRFISGLNALLFVVDSEELLQRRQRGARLVGDRAFDVVLDRLGAVHGYTPAGFIPLPAAVVVAKADLLRFYGEPELDRWFALGNSDETDLSTVESESEDAYRLLYRRGSGYLAPAQRFLRTSLHFATATGTAPESTEAATYPIDGFGPRRTLKPLLSLFQMIGVVSPPVRTGSPT